jgi:hypothetical protein
VAGVSISLFSTLAVVLSATLLATLLLLAGLLLSALLLLAGLLLSALLLLARLLVWILILIHHSLQRWFGSATEFALHGKR